MLTSPTTDSIRAASFTFKHIPDSLRPAFVIPVYNHGRYVADVVKSALRTGAPVYVVDDGSSDITPGVLDSFSGAAVLRHPKNLGKGAALLTGFEAAAQSSQWAVTVDADGQHDPQEAFRLVKAVPAGLRPIVIGRRRGMNESNIPQTSSLGRHFSNFWVWISGGIRLSDTQCGFRLYPIPEVLNLKAKSRRYQFEVEILVLAAWTGMPIIEVDVTVKYPPRRERVSHFEPGRDFWRNTKVFSRLIAERMVLPRARRVRTYREK